MASTVVAPVGNQIASAINYVPYLDEVYKAESKTAILDTADEQVRFVGANTVEFFTLDTVGMANYDRNAGLVPGDVNGAWVPYQLETDRGRSYQLDVMDNEFVIDRYGNDRLHLALSVDFTYSHVSNLHC